MTSETVYDSFVGGSLSISGLLSGESYTESSSADGHTYTIQFYKDAAKTQKGLQQSSADRELEITFRTKVGDDWFQMVEDFFRETRNGSYAQRKDIHTNTVRITDGATTNSATATNAPTRLIKSLMSVQSLEATNIGLGTYPLYEHRLELSSVRLEDIQGEWLVIEDTFDTDLLLPYTGYTLSSGGGGNISWGFLPATDEMPWLTPSILITNSGRLTKENLNGTSWSSDDGNLVAEPTATGMRIKIRKSHLQSWPGFDGYITIRYRLIGTDTLVERSEAQKVQTGDGNIPLTNTASYLGSPSTVTTNYDYPGIAKNRVTSTRDRLDPDAVLSPTSENDYTQGYEVFVNPHGWDLDPESDYLIVTDESEQLRVVTGSVKIWLKNGANATSFTHYTGSDYYVTEYTENGFKVRIPDGQPVKITYNAKILGAGSVKITNTATVRTYTATSSMTTTVGSRVHGWGSDIGARLLKHELGDAEKPIQGAEFSLYEVDPATGELKTPSVGNKVFTTDANGLIHVASCAEYTLHEDTIYAFVETKAAPGYELDPTPVYFAIGETGTVSFQKGGQTISVPQNVPNWEYTKANEVRKEKPVRFLKADPNGDPLDGAEVEVQSLASGVSDWTQARDADWTTEQSWTTDSTNNTADGSGLSLTLTPGVYRMLEKTAPVGYRESAPVVFRVEDDYSVTLLGDDNSGQVASGEDAVLLTMTDPYEVIVLEKLDSITRAPLEDVSFVLTKDIVPGQQYNSPIDFSSFSAAWNSFAENYGIAFVREASEGVTTYRMATEAEINDNSVTKVKTLKTDANGRIRISGLAQDEVYFYETVVPAGYKNPNQFDLQSKFLYAEALARLYRKADGSRALEASLLAPGEIRFEKDADTQELRISIDNTPMDPNPPRAGGAKLLKRDGTTGEPIKGAWFDAYLEIPADIGDMPCEVGTVSEFYSGWFGTLPQGTGPYRVRLGTFPTDERGEYDFSEINHRLLDCEAELVKALTVPEGEDRMMYLERLRGIVNIVLEETTPAEGYQANSGDTLFVMERAWDMPYVELDPWGRPTGESMSFTWTAIEQNSFVDVEYGPDGTTYTIMNNPYRIFKESSKGSDPDLEATFQLYMIDPNLFSSTWTTDDIVTFTGGNTKFRPSGYMYDLYEMGDPITIGTKDANAGIDLNVLRLTERMEAFLARATTYYEREALKRKITQRATRMVLREVSAPEGYGARDAGIFLDYEWVDKGDTLVPVLKQFEFGNVSNYPSGEFVIKNVPIWLYKSNGTAHIGGAAFKSYLALPENWQTVGGGAFATAMNDLVSTLTGGAQTSVGLIPGTTDVYGIPLACESTYNEATQTYSFAPGAVEVPEQGVMLFDELINKEALHAYYAAAYPYRSSISLTSPQIYLQETVVPEGYATPEEPAVIVLSVTKLEGQQDSLTNLEYMVSQMPVGGRLVDTYYTRDVEVGNEPVYDLPLRKVSTTTVPGATGSKIVLRAQISATPPIVQVQSIRPGARLLGDGNDAAAEPTLAADPNASAHEIIFKVEGSSNELGLRFSARVGNLPNGRYGDFTFTNGYGEATVPAGTKRSAVLRLPLSVSAVEVTGVDFLNPDDPGGWGWSSVSLFSGDNTGELLSLPRTIALQSNPDGEVRQVISNVRFKLQPLDGEGAPTGDPIYATTDAKGEAVFPDLKPGRYLLSEETEVPGHYKAEDVIVDILRDGTVFVDGTLMEDNVATIVNRAYSGLKLVKMGSSVAGSETLVYVSSMVTNEEEIPAPTGQQQQSIKPSPGLLSLQGASKAPLLLGESPSPSVHRISFMTDGALNPSPLKFELDVGDASFNQLVDGVQFVNGKGILTLNKSENVTLNFPLSISRIGYRPVDGGIPAPITINVFWPSHAGEPVIMGANSPTQWVNLGDLLAGVAFTLQRVDTNGDPIGEPLSGTTDLNGSITFEGELTPGEYILHEVAAPSGYAAIEDVRLTIDEHGNVLLANGEKVEGGELVIVDPTENTGSFTIYKADDDLQSRSTGQAREISFQIRELPEVEVQSVGPVTRLQAARVATAQDGAGQELRRVDGISAVLNRAPLGTSAVGSIENGEHVISFPPLQSDAALTMMIRVCGPDGEVDTSLNGLYGDIGLSRGEGRVIIKAGGPTQYLRIPLYDEDATAGTLDRRVILSDVTVSGGNTFILHVDEEEYPIRQLPAEALNFYIGTEEIGHPLSGAGFMLRRMEGGQLVGESLTGSTVNGRLTFSGLSEGTYVLAETNPPEGHYGVEPCRVIVDSDGNVTIEGGTLLANGEWLFTDPAYYDLELLKTEDEAKQIDGDTVVVHWDTSAQDHVTPDVVTSSLDGYHTIALVSPQKKPGEDGDTCEVRFTLLDANGNAIDGIESASLTPYGTDNTIGITNGVGVANLPFSTPRNTQVTVLRIPTNVRKITVSVGSNGTGYIKWGDGAWQAGGVQNSLAVTSTGWLAVPNAEFTLSGTANDGTEINRVCTADEIGRLRFEALPPGMYTLSETGVPEGYEAVADWSVSVSETGVVGLSQNSPNAPEPILYTPGTALRLEDPKEYGELDVLKTVLGGVENDSFVFRVTLYTDAERTNVATEVNSADYADAGHFGAYGAANAKQNVVFNRGVAEFPLKDGESAELQNLWTKYYYRVEEVLSPAQQGVYVAQEDRIGRIEKTGTAETFENIGKGDLQIHKRLLGRLQDEMMEFAFYLRLTDAENVPITQAQLDAAGTSAIIGTTQYSLVLDAAAPAVTGVRDADGIPTNLPAGSYVRIKQSGASASQDILLKGGETITINGLVPGWKYTVYEKDYSSNLEGSYVTSFELPEGENTVPAGETREVTVYNAREGILIHKVNGEDPPATLNGARFKLMRLTNEGDPPVIREVQVGEELVLENGEGEFVFPSSFAELFEAGAETIYLRLYETEAPDGYAAPKDYWPIEVKKRTSFVEGDVVRPGEYEITVLDRQNHTLPMVPNASAADGGISPGVDSGEYDLENELLPEVELKKVQFNTQVTTQTDGEGFTGEKIEQSVPGLANVEFTLYKEVEQGTEGAIQLETPAGAKWVVVAKNRAGIELANQSTNAQGNISFGTLELGSYWLAETKPPSGYIRLEPTHVSVAADGITYSNPAMHGGGPQDAIKRTEGQQTYYAMVLLNTPENLVLPQSGGLGAALYSSLGLALLLCTGVLYTVARKRRMEKDAE